jgi:hypothetical protein
MIQITRVGPWLVLLLGLAAVGCGGDSSDGDPDGDVTPDDTVVDVPADTPGETPADVPGDVPGDVPSDPGEVGDIPEVLPDGAVCGEWQCSNCIDDDGDGFTDGFDPHCSSSLDRDEGSFATGIPGDNRDTQWQDCFFDGNSGGGDDGCRFHTCCLLGAACPATLADGFDPMTDCELDAECIEFCMPGTTPGCDCFGCCEIWVGDTAYTVYTNPAISPDCTMDRIADPTACLPCTPTTDCGNPCVPEDCELCPGMTVDDLPPECSDTPPTCDPGVTPCETTADCPTMYYCSMGCCIEDVVLI